MALFLFLLFVSGPLCVFFFKAFPGAAALGHPIPLLSFAADLTSRAAPSCSGSSDERSSSDSEKIGQTGGYPRLTSLSIKALPRGEQKLQDEYVLDSGIHSRLDPLWNFRNLQKHSRRGLVMIFSKITRC